MVGWLVSDECSDTDYAVGVNEDCKDSVIWLTWLVWLAG